MPVGWRAHKRIGNGGNIEIQELKWKIIGFTKFLSLSRLSVACRISWLKGERPRTRTLAACTQMKAVSTLRQQKKPIILVCSYPSRVSNLPENFSILSVEDVPVLRSSLQPQTISHFYFILQEYSALIRTISFIRQCDTSHSLYLGLPSWRNGTSPYPSQCPASFFQARNLHSEMGTFSFEHKSRRGMIEKISFNSHWNLTLHFPFPPFNSNHFVFIFQARFHLI